MASIRLTKFSGIIPAIAPELLPPENAQRAHNCILSDGTIRPQATWMRIGVKNTPNIKGIFYTRSTDVLSFCLAREPVTLYGEPFQDKIAVGALGDIYMFKNGDGMTKYQACMNETGLSGSASYERAYNSNKPINRLYAATRVRKTGNYIAESPMTLFSSQGPYAVLYEGDLVTVNVSGTTPGLDGATHIRIYRSMSGLDTGHPIANEEDTNWHLVAEVPIHGDSFSFTDGESVTGIPLDMNYSNKFHNLFSAPYFFGLSESGWFVAASPDGDIQVSERYMHHAWPVENHLHVPHNIMSMAVSNDNVYLGTDEYPYVGSLSFGDSPMQAAFKPFVEYMPCLGDSMAATPTGAIYASSKGIVSLSREGMHVLTQNMLTGGETLFNKEIIQSGSEVNSYRIVSDYSGIGHGLYYQGTYYAFITGKATIIDPPNP